jgi:hypothetical protein
VQGNESRSSDSHLLSPAIKIVVFKAKAKATATEVATVVVAIAIAPPYERFPATLAPPNKLPELDDQVTISMIVEAFIAKTKNTSMPPPPT